jgi:hypothetical protein
MAKQVWDVEKTIVTRHFDELSDLTLDLTDLFPDIATFTECQIAAIANGVKQKLADIYAKNKDQTYTDAEKRVLISERWTDICDGNWNVKAGVGSRGPSVSLKVLVPALIQAGLDEAAIAAATGKTIEVIEKFLETGEE